jgi:hypothetical protein
MSQVNPAVRYLTVCEDVLIDPMNPGRVKMIAQHPLLLR